MGYALRRVLMWVSSVFRWKRKVGDEGNSKLSVLPAEEHDV